LSRGATTASIHLAGQAELTQSLAKGREGMRLLGGGERSDASLILMAEAWRWSGGYDAVP